MKDTESLADILAGLRGKHEKQSPDRPGPKGFPSRKLLLHRRRLSGSNLVADRDGAKNSDEAWRRRHDQAPQHPFRLRDIAEAGPRGSYVLLLIPLKLRDVEDAFSSYHLPLASILLASRPKGTGPPSPGVDHGRCGKASRARGKL